MAWRSVVIESPCKISAGGNYLIVRGDELKKIHLSEIYYLMIASPAVSITGVALCELNRNKVKVVFCDERRNPYGEFSPYYGSHNCSKKIRQQVAWDKSTISAVNTAILAKKIENQSALLKKLGFDERAAMLQEYLSEMEADDATNREVLAAKVYFNALFGMGFIRDENNAVNGALNYGYTVLLSCVNREVAANGCLTQLGVNHCNEFNEFNLSCDLMEPFRVVVDEYVYMHKERNLDTEYKHELVNLLNKRVRMERECDLHDAVAASVKSAIESLNNGTSEYLRLYDFQ